MDELEDWTLLFPLSSFFSFLGMCLVVSFFLSFFLSSCLTLVLLDLVPARDIQSYIFDFEGIYRKGLLMFYV